MASNTEISTFETENDVKNVSSTEQLKAVLSCVIDQSTNLKNIINMVRTVLKEHEKQTKELEKLRNKKSRNKSERSANALPSGITKPVSISEELAKFLNVEVGTLVPRNEVTKGVAAYVKKFELSDPTNKQRFVLDSRPQAVVLKNLLGEPKEDVTYFNLQRYLKHHYLPLGDKKLQEEPLPKELPEQPLVVKKKTIMVKKKKSQELTEEA